MTHQNNFNINTNQTEKQNQGSAAKNCKE